MEGLGDILRRLLETEPGFREAWAMVNIEKHWVAIAGQELSAYVRVQDLRRGVLYLEVSNPAWATQMHYYKETLLERIKLQAPNAEVFEIKTRVAELTRKPETAMVDPPIHTREDLAQRIDPLLEGLDPSSAQYAEMHAVLEKYVRWQEQDKRPVCPICGQRYQGVDEICIYCKNEDLTGKDKDVVSYLIEAPWSRFSDILQDNPGTEETHYHRIKEKLTAQKHDKIQSLYFEYTKNPVVKLKKVMEKEVLTFVMLRTGLTPDKVTPAIIQQQISSRLFTLLYK